jgi:hypothetical protein
MAGSTKVKQARKSPKKKRAALSNERLLRLAKKHRPPQSWYDENTNPFEPKR